MVIAWSSSPVSLKILHLSIFDLQVMTSFIGYYGQCVWSHFACTVSYDLRIAGKLFPHI